MEGNFQKWTHSDAFFSRSNIFFERSATCPGGWGYQGFAGAAVGHRILQVHYKFDTSLSRVTYYVYETNEAGSEEGRLMISSTNNRKLEFGGLTTGKVYYFYIRAKTSAGFGPPSKVLR